MRPVNPLNAFALNELTYNGGEIVLLPSVSQTGEATSVWIGSRDIPFTLESVGVFGEECVNDFLAGVFPESLLAICSSDQAWHRRIGLFPSMTSIPAVVNSRLSWMINRGAIQNAFAVNTITGKIEIIGETNQTAKAVQHATQLTWIIELFADTQQCECTNDVLVVAHKFLRASSSANANTDPVMCTWTIQPTVWQKLVGVDSSNLANDLDAALQQFIVSSNNNANILLYGVNGPVIRLTKKETADNTIVIGSMQ